MNRHGFFNLVLVISFLFTNIGGMTIGQNRTGPDRNSWDIKPEWQIITSKISSWLDRIQSEQTELLDTTPVGMVPTSTSTPGLGIVPTREATLTAEPTITPRIIPTETMIPTLTPTVTVTPTSTLPPDEGFLLATVEINLDPDPAAPGDVVTATWTIHNYHGQYNGMEAWLYLPEAFIPVEAGGGSFNPETNLLIVPIDSANGLISWFIDGNAQPPYEILVEVRLNGQVIMSVTRSLGERGPDFVSKGGGEAHGFNGHVKVNFPAGALPVDADVSVLAPENTELSLGGRPMELTAIGKDSGMEITQFSQPVTITVQYTDEEAARLLKTAGMLDETSLSLFYYDESVNTWIPLPTSLDPDTNQFTAVTDHFSLFDFQAQNWEAARLPSLDGFQLSGFTGAGSYSYPIQVPPGPGGLQPSVALSYNTQEVDSSSSRTQASWVGMGWSLDTGYIQRNMNGTPNYFEDDTFSLVMNGVGGLLLPTESQQGGPNTIDYHLANENFWLVRQYLESGDVGGYNGDFSQWVVFAPDGTKYYFGNYYDTTNGDIHGGHAWYVTCPNQYHPAYMQTWKWSLTRVRNIYGKELTYTYYNELLTKDGNGCSGYQHTMTMAVYPDSIIYPNNRYRIIFTRDLYQGAGTRTDFDKTWKDWLTTTTLFMQSNLKQIEVWHDPDGIWNNGDKILIRKYVLRFGEGGQQIFPGVTWPGWTGNNGKTLTLTSITEYGLNGTNPLPATTFKYWPMHFKSMENGYGGKLEYYVENWHADNGFESYLYSPDVVYNITGEWYPDTDGDNELDDLKTYFQPGIFYKVSVRVKQNAGSTVQLGLNEGGTKDYGNVTNLNPGQWTTVTSYIMISGSASQARAFIQCNSTCDLDWYEVYPLVTRYLITQKTITDQVTGEQYTTLYSYEGAAVNDAAHSVYVTNDPGGEHLMTKPNTEFRGHSHVTETDLDVDGETILKKIETWYSQDDIYKGQASKTQVTDSSGNIYTESDITFANQETSTYNLPHPEGQPANSDLKIYWIYTTFEENRTYNGDTTYVATRNEYQYLINDQGGTQFGNRTRIITSSWSGYDWRAYRGSTTVFNPMVSDGEPETSRYLVSLPGYTKTFQCPGGCDWVESDAIGTQWYLYDGHGMHNIQPHDGILTGSRLKIFFTPPPNNVAMYADTVYGYDSWGNQTSVTVYTGPTDVNSFGLGTGSQTTTSCYGTGPAPTCSEDNYGTYLAWQKNDLGQAQQFTYDKTMSVLTRTTDPNNAFTDASYDEFGRILTIVRPGDDSDNPTATMSYHNNSAPFINNPYWTEAKQRINGSNYFSIRKYYTGIGQMIQTQVVGATIGNQTRDILTDTWYDAGGRVNQQSVPYDVATGYTYSGRSDTAAYTYTTYDILGRILSSEAPDGNTTTYSYWDGYTNEVPFLYSRVTNARGYYTTTKSDVWGKVVLVTPPTGPTVSYTYDAADRLWTIVRGGATTTLGYDFGGRKTSMSDPDMGGWSYSYDALGNLETQTDARGCITTLSYDDLNRLTGKSYSGACSGTAVSYTYDAGTYGKGRRTGMTDGSGSTSWTYDSRGRMTQETKTITGSGAFVTQWGYNSADLVTTMRYPANNTSGLGETVTFTYLNQMLMDTVTGTSTYVNNTDYDAAGRVDVRDLGLSEGNPVIRVDYTYFNWTDVNGQGRLSQITSGSIVTPNSLQQLNYTYDANGNIKTIVDNKAGPQTQTFTYDELDRLMRGYTSGGTYIYDQSYEYSATTGNMSKMAGANYSYSSAHPHAVEQNVGTGGTNRTVTIRAKGVNGCSGWPSMDLRINGTVRGTWTVNTTTYQNYSVSTNITGNDRVEVVYTNDSCILGSRDLYVDYVIVNGTTVQAEGPSTVIDWGSGSDAFDWQNVIAGQEAVTSNGALRFVLGSQIFASGYDSNGNMTTRLSNGAKYFYSYDAENRLIGVNGSASATFVYDGNGNRVTGTMATTKAYIGNYLEYSTSGIVKYYYAGSVRVAMRDTSGALKFLLGDHLGSTSTITESDGSNPINFWYYPWGGQRYASGLSPTTFRYTGQRLESGIGLYFYGARWYDPYLNRWIQPDQIIPDPSNSQSYDRYAYVLNNPVRYTDPTGHDVCDEEGNCYNSQGWYRAKYAQRLSTIDTWKMMILGKYGVTMSDEGGKNWDANNLQLVFTSLGNINASINGKIQEYSFGATFKLGEYHPPSDKPLLTYSGLTSGSNITFYTMGNAYIHQMNIYHEFGHLINNHFADPFTKSDFSEHPPSWVDSGYISGDAYGSYWIQNDPNYPYVQAIQASESGGSEIWADAFANLVVGNIDLSLSDSPGSDMSKFVKDTLGIP